MVHPVLPEVQSWFLPDFGGEVRSVETGKQAGADVILVGCGRITNPVPSAASDLFAGPLFAGRRRYAASSGLPWYIVSARFGLLAPDDVVGPHDGHFSGQSAAYKKAWAEFVAVQLEQRVRALRRRTIEVHAGAAHVDPLRAPLAARGATLTVPLESLRPGEQLAWYRAGAADGRPPGGAEPAAAPGASPADLAQLLSDPSRALSPRELLRGGGPGARTPGLYSWWADNMAAADLSRGLGHPVPPGLVYLGGAAEFAALCRTLAAILRPVLGLTREDDPQLSAWINTHLGVNAVPAPDPEHLPETETALLALLAPPLNAPDLPSVPAPRSDPARPRPRSRARRPVPHQVSHAD